MSTAQYAKSRAAHGQAMVEMALGSLVFVSVFIFGIYFAEVGFLSLKPLEAVNFALFDATGRQQHDFATATAASPVNMSLYEDAARSGRDMAQVSYADLDATRTLSPAMSEVFTRVAPQRDGLIEMDCQTGAAGQVMGLDPNGAFKATPDLAQGLPAPLGGKTGMRCSASSVISSVRIPRAFFEVGGGGFFSTQNWSGIDIRACAVGRASGGVCPGQVGILLDDWGLAGLGESAECPLVDQAGNKGSGCRNPGYYKIASKVYGGTGILGKFKGTRGQDLVQLVKGTANLTGKTETNYWLSFVGADSAFMDKLPGGSHGGDPKWQTTPFKTGTQTTPYYSAYQTRSNGHSCFLGMSCR